jgi:hypothetical protein
LAFLVKATRRGNDFVTECIRIHKAVIYGHSVRKLLKLFWVISEIGDLLLEDLGSCQREV